MLTREGLPAAARLFDDRVADLLLRYAGEGPYERDLFVPDERAVAGLRAAAEAVRADLAAAGTAVPEPLRGFLADCLAGLAADLAADAARPATFIRGFAGGLLRAVTEDPRPPGEIGPVVAARLAGAPALFAAVEARCRALPDDRIAAVREALDAATGILGECRATVAGWPGGAVIVAGTDAATEAARRAGAALAALQGGGREVAPEPAGAYADLLAGRFGIALDELLAWHEDAVAAEGEELARAAAAIAPGVPAPVLLDERSGPYAGPEAMFAAAGECLALARSRARELIALPAGEECRIRPLPRLLESSYPWGAAHGFPPLRGILTGTWYLNAANWRAVTRGWVQMMAIHEVYPGHHAQNVKTAVGDLPISAKVAGFNGRATPLVEGIAHRSEELLSDLYGDPLFPLFVRFRRLHTALRVQADLLLHHFGRPAAEVARLYVDRLGFSPESARGQVHYQELHPGYMVCYYYGYRALAGLRAASPLAEREFSETTFACGYTTLEVAWRALAARARDAGAEGV